MLVCDVEGLFSKVERQTRIDDGKADRSLSAEVEEREVCRGRRRVDKSNHRDGVEK